MRFLCTAVLVACATPALSATVVTLYDQDFENPAAFVNNGGDVNISTSVNENYSNQPPGFVFSQTFTVETLNISGSERGPFSAAFGTGYSDPEGKFGNFSIGLLATLQNDLLGLAFDVGDFPFLNFSIDVTSLDLSVFSGPFVRPGDEPEFQFSLFDNPGGAPGIGGGTLLDQVTVTATASPQTVVDATTAVLGLSTAGNTDGNVIFQIDLLSGGYASFDNLLVTAAEIEGDVGAVVPLPAPLALLLSGLAGLGLVARTRRTA